MTDNTPVKNASAATVSVSTDELSDASQSPKVTLLDGTGSPVGISPATETTLASVATVVKAEDAAHVSGDAGIMALGVRKDTAIALAADGDYQPPIYDSTGKQWVNAGGLTLIDVTLSLDTSAYASGDLLAETQAVASAVRVNDGKGILHSVMVIDEDDQGVAFDLYFLSANNTFGSENSAPSISDASARDILGIVPVAAAEYKDLGGVKVAIKTGLNIIIKGASGSTSIYVAAVNGSSAPTYSASGVRLRVGIVQD